MNGHDSIVLWSGFFAALEGAVENAKLLRGKQLALITRASFG